MKTFTEQISQLLGTYGFTETDNVFTLTKEVAQPGQTMIINGQRFEQPGKTIEVINRVYMLGDGWVSNLDDTNKQDMLWIKFEALIENESQGDITHAFYANDYDQFNNMLCKIFKLC